MEPVVRMTPGAARELARIYVGLGRRRQADSVRAIIEAGATHGGRYADVASVYATLGDTTRALQWLTRAIDRYDGGLLNLQLPTAEEFSFLRNDPRFKALEARMGIKP